MDGGAIVSYHHPSSCRGQNYEHRGSFLGGHRQITATGITFNTILSMMIAGILGRPVAMRRCDRENFTEVLSITTSGGLPSEGNSPAAHVRMRPFAPHGMLKTIHGTEKLPLTLGSSRRGEKVRTSVTPLHNRNHSLDITRTLKNTEYG